MWWVLLSPKSSTFLFYVAKKINNLTIIYLPFTNYKIIIKLVGNYAKNSNNKLLKINQSKNKFLLVKIKRYNFLK